MLTKLDEESENVSNDERDLSTRIEHRATSNLFQVFIQALDQGALGEHEVEHESSQAEREEEADPDESRVCPDHATVSDYRADESMGGSRCKHGVMEKSTVGVGDIPEERDEGDDSENNTSDDDTDPGTGRDLDLGVVQEVRVRIDG